MIQRSIAQFDLCQIVVVLDRRFTMIRQAASWLNLASGIITQEFKSRKNPGSSYKLVRIRLNSAIVSVP